MKPILFYILSLGFGMESIAQQLPNFRNEVYAPQWHNPASFGTWNKFSVNALAQYSVIGDYGYVTSVISGEGFISTGHHTSGIGVGAYYQYDKIAFEEMQRTALNLNYQFSFEKVNLSIGFSPGVTSINLDPDWIPPTNVADPNLPEGGSQIKASIGAGFFLYTDKFYAGISGAQLNHPLFDVINIQAAPHFFFHSGYRFKATKNIQIFPSFSIASDVSTNYFSATCLIQFIKPALSVGVNYSSAWAIRGIVGYEFKGLSFLYSLGTDLSILTNATHFQQELRLSFRLKNTLKCSTCEYF